MLVCIDAILSAKTSLTNNTIHMNMYIRMTDFKSEVFGFMINSPKI